MNSTSKASLYHGRRDEVLALLADGDRTQPSWYDRLFNEWRVALRAEARGNPIPVDPTPARVRECCRRLVGTISEA